MFTLGQPLSAKAKGLLFALTIVLALGVLSSLADQLIPLFPMDTGIAQWRFERAGTFLGSVPVILLQLAALIIAAGLAGMRGTVRLASLFALLVGLLMIPFLLAFLLDFVEVRRVVNVTNRMRFDLAAMKAGIFGALFIVPAIWMGWRGWQATVLTEQGTRTKGEGLVVGQ